MPIALSASNQKKADRYIEALVQAGAGREEIVSLLADLPEGVDPCGENGEFHTFVCAAPNFSHSIPVRVGERVEREGFWFADLLAAGHAADSPADSPKEP